MGMGCETINSAILSCQTMSDNKSREDENENIKADDCLDFSFQNPQFIHTLSINIGINYFFICRL